MPVTTGRDDDALSWGGDDDPTLEVGARPAPADDAPPAAGLAQSSAPSASDEPLALPGGYTAVGRGSDDVGRIHDDGTVVMSGERVPMSNALLVTLGIVAGVYLLYTIGWIIGGLRLQGTAQFLVSPVGYQFALLLAIVAPALWFVAVFVLTRAAKVWLRIVWLVGGLALLIPWPFIMVGAVGQ